MIHPDHQHSQLGWTYKGYAFVFIMVLISFYDNLSTILDCCLLPGMRMDINSPQYESFPSGVHFPGNED